MQETHPKMTNREIELMRLGETNKSIPMSHAQYGMQHAYIVHHWHPFESSEFLPQVRLNPGYIAK